MAKINVKLDGLEEAIANELTLYHESIIVEMKKTAQSTMQELVKETKSQRYKQDTGAYRKAISSRKLEETKDGLIMQWYVKAPHYRLTHLLEYGHATRGGSRTKGYGNLGKATDKAIESYEKAIKEVIEND